MKLANLEVIQHPYAVETETQTERQYGGIIIEIVHSPIFFEPALRYNMHRKASISGRLNLTGRWKK